LSEEKAIRGRGREWKEIDNRKIINAQPICESGWAAAFLVGRSYQPPLHILQAALNFKAMRAAKSWGGLT